MSARSWPSGPVLAPEDALAQWLEGLVLPPGVLGTIGEDGIPDARTLVLTGIDGCDVSVNGDDRSRKAAQLEARPVASYVLSLPSSMRQIVLRGRVRPQRAEELAAAYARRPRHLQLLAWLNDDDFAAATPHERQRRWSEADARADLAGAVAPHWCGYVLEPSEITLWQAGHGAGSIRLRYRRASNGAWTTTVLPG